MVVLDGGTKEGAKLVEHITTKYESSVVDSMVWPSAFFGRSSFAIEIRSCLAKVHRLRSRGVQPDNFAERFLAARARLGITSHGRAGG